MEPGSGDGPGGNRGVLGRRGGSGGKTPRLPSIRPQRDLTLGGVKKKTFTPNIPSRRVKEDINPEASTSTAVSQSDKKSESSHRGRHERGRGRGRGRGEREVIQSHSIFEQGPTDGVRNRRGAGYSGGSGERKEPSSRPSIKREKKDTKHILDDLLKDDFVEGGQTDGDFMPVRLPLANMKKEIKKETDIKPSLSIKEEPLDVDAVDMEQPAEVPGVPHRTPESEICRPATAAELFTSPSKQEDGELMIIQLPDVMPGDPPARDDTDAATANKEASNNTSESKTPEDELAAKLGLCSLGDFSEGCIGKLQVLKSGRTRLVFGNNVSLDVTMGTPAGFLQDLASIRVDGEEGDMMVLGHIDHKLICVPDFESFLDDT